MQLQNKNQPILPNLLQLRDYSFLAQAAYRDLSALSANRPPRDLEAALTDLTSSTGRGNVFTDLQAKLLTGSITSDLNDGFTFIDYHPNDFLVGFSAKTKGVRDI